MTSVKFPRRKQDGTFCVEVGLQISSDDIATDVAAQIQVWFDETWMSANKTWIRPWSSGPDFATKREQVLSYSDEFLAPPEVRAKGDAELCIKLLGAGTAKFWKDWLVLKIGHDLKKQFPEVGELLYIRDCEP
jgi:hypothetical protein